jgi:hypothetical protein
MSVDECTYFKTPTVTLYLKIPYIATTGVLSEMLRNFKFREVLPFNLLLVCSLDRLEWYRSSRIYMICAYELPHDRNIWEIPESHQTTVVKTSKV